MMQRNFDNGGDPDWEDRGSLLWSEYDWQQYLKGNEEDIKQFLEFYLKNRHEPNHLDCVAQRLGWGQVEWVASILEDDNEDEEDAWVSDVELEEGMVGNYELPYTVHRHPIFIVTRGLVLHLSRSWQYCFSRHPECMSAAWAWNFFNILHLAELNALMAVQAVDLADFNLAICHFKNGLSAINQGFNVLNAVPGHATAPSESLLKDTRLVLFDLRDIWLRVIRECREEIKFETDGFDGNTF